MRLSYTVSRNDYLVIDPVVNEYVPDLMAFHSWPSARDIANKLIWFLDRTDKK